MLVLTRKIGEVIQIGDEIEVVVLSTSGGRVKLGFSAPPEVRINRAELADAATLPNATMQPETAPTSRRPGLLRLRPTSLAVRRP